MDHLQVNIMCVLNAHCISLEHTYIHSTQHWALKTHISQTLVFLS